MNKNPQQLVTRFKKALGRNKNGAEAANGAGAEPESPTNNKPKTAGAFSAAFKFKLASRKEENGTTPVHRSVKAKDFNTPLFRELSPQLREQSKGHPHLWEYLNTLPIEELGLPEFYPRLNRSLRELEYRNLVYPVGKGTFVHIRPDKSASRDSYMSVEPSMNPELPGIMEQIDKRLINYVDRLKGATTDDQRTQVLLKCLEEICSIKGKGRHGGNTIQVTEKEMDGLRYLMKRDKEGLREIDPMINDSYIEDITCSGVGSLFVEHKIFGGLKAGIGFDTMEQLDRYVIKLSEKIKRPVTVREPIVDAVLPDGSRVNIVYGGDVSKRGSNFTIRKFNTTPMSILDLIGLGTLSFEMAAYLSLMVGEGMNTFISGETASGKTTLLDAVTTLINSNHKIVSIEDTPELQVPHPNWTRQVVRGAGSAGASVTMFDLLRAALRQRPNEIIIGEIRGEEGSVAFQAMQTGHSCMAIFHAASVEKLIQRLTGNPINIPKTYIDNLNLVVIISAVRLPDGTPARRVMNIDEIVEYDSESDTFGFIEVFRWDSATDTFDFPGYMNTNLLEHVVGPRRGILPHNSRQIYTEIEERAEILRKLHDREITNFCELHNILAQAYREGLFR